MTAITRRGAITAFLLAGAGFDPAAAQGRHAELHVDTLSIQGHARTFRVHVPPSGGPGAPLVFALHGGGGDGARFREILGRRLEHLAARGGFVVAYPDGWERHWNDCRAGTGFVAKRLGVDDVGFLRALVARLRRTQEVDPARVRVIGFSNGGHMAYRLALEASDDVQAIAAIGANLPTDDNLDCVPSGVAVPVLAVLGTADSLSPYSGGEAKGFDGSSRGRVRSGPETAAWFARLAGAHGEPRRERLLEPDPVSRTWVERLAWDSGDGLEVVLLAVHGGGHVIPGPGMIFPEEAGPVEQRIDVIEEAVRFFDRQPPTRARAGTPGPKAGSGLAGVTVVTALTAADAGGDPVTAGSWRLSFGRDGRFSAEQDGVAAVEGRYDVSGDRLALHDGVGTMACEGRPGVYRWSFSSDFLEMERVEDLCPGRTAVLTAHPLRRECP